MNWKNKLEMVLAKAQESEKTETGLNKALTKADKTNKNIVSSAFVSAEKAYFPKNPIKTKIFPECSKCGLEMILIENNTLWFCPFGCEKQLA